ncbi:hypothetical protein KY284_032881 [Solanum tuberosum]|nr:hypothetical protein KY284_032881 [Solanum tuberosum]
MRAAETDDQYVSLVYEACTRVVVAYQNELRFLPICVRSNLVLYGWENASTRLLVLMGEWNSLKKFKDGNRLGRVELNPQNF